MSNFNNGSRQGQQVRTGRFGEPEVLKTAYEVVNKKSGEIIPDHYKCYFEVGSQLFKIEISPRLKETKKGGNAMWVKITKKVKQRAVASSF